MPPHTVTLNDGTQIPWIGFGTGTTLYKQDVRDVVKIAIQHGFTHLDGAQVYENEESLSAGITASGKARSELYITTKLGRVPPGKTIRDTVVESLKKLRVSYVDLFLIHTPTLHRPGTLGTVWKELEALKAEGLTRSIGVSNFQLKHLEEVLKVATVVPAINQIEYHPYVYKASLPLLELQKKHGIATASYGGLTPIVHAYGGPTDAVVSTIRARLANDTGKDVTDGQVLGLWLRAHDIPQITTTSKEERLKEYLATLELPDLTPEEVAAINEAGSKLHKRIYKHGYDE